MTRDQIKRVVGYLRVSTQEQGDSGAGLEAQRAAIEAKAAERGWELLEIFQDVASGKSMQKRPELKRCMAQLQAGKADGLIVAKLDRLSRSVPDFGSILEVARRQNWAMVALDFELDTSTPAGELVANVLMSVAQWERRVIGQRTKEGLAIRRAQGVRLGKARQITPETERYIVRRRRDGKASFATIAEDLNKRGVASPGGKPWAWTTVQRVVRRHLDEPIKSRQRAG